MELDVQGQGGGKILDGFCTMSKRSLLENWTTFLDAICVSSLLNISELSKLAADREFLNLYLKSV